MSVRGSARYAGLAVVVIALAAGVAGCGRLGFDPAASLCVECYRLVIEPAPYEQAAAACDGEGEHLVTIGGPAENRAVLALAATIPYDEDETTNHRSIMWMGGTAAAEVSDPSSWGWDTGEPMDYDNWRAGEPSDEDEHCVIMLGQEDGRWDNRPCELAYAYLCERPAAGP